MTYSQADSIGKNLDVVLRQLAKPLEPLIEAMSRISQAMAPYIEQLVKYHKFIDSVSATGWLPYHTVSIDYVEECGDGRSGKLDLTIDCVKAVDGQNRSLSPAISGFNVISLTA